MNNGTPANKSPLWSARQRLGVKRGALRRRQEKLRELEAEVRVLERTVRSLEQSSGERS